jgi:hypothetical protein
VRVGYAKLGRSWQLDADKASTVGGDIDVVRLLKFLANEHPEHEFTLIGRNSGQVPQELGYPSNVINPWTEWKKEWEMPTDPLLADTVVERFRRISGNYHETLDGIVVWAGQHGSANSLIPMIGSDWIEPPVWPEITRGKGERLATPQFAFMNYCYWLLDMISRWRELDLQKNEEVWLCPDPRNYLKCRELRWPLRYPVMGQYKMIRQHKSERYGRFDGLESFTGHREQSVWVDDVRYEYSGIELTALPQPDKIMVATRPRAYPFGMIINENRKGVRNQRLDVMQRWVTPFFKRCPIYGEWTVESQVEMGRRIDTVPYTSLQDAMASFTCTFTTPASGTGWATSKPWECFAAGIVCFFHPEYDTQGHILPATLPQMLRASDDIAMLSNFLRVETPEQLRDRVQSVQNDVELWKKLVTLQRTLFEERWKLWRGGALAVEKRLGLA